MLSIANSSLAASTASLASFLNLANTSNAALVTTAGMIKSNVTTNTTNNTTNPIAALTCTTTGVAPNFVVTCK